MRIGTLHSTLMAVAASLSAALIPASLRANDEKPVPRVSQVNLERYAGSWFIIGSIPLSLEKGAHNPVETYTL